MHFRRPTKKDETSSQLPRKQSSRIPTTSTTSNSNRDDERSRGTRAVAEPASKASRTLDPTAADKATRDTASSFRAPTLASTAQRAVVPSKRASAAPSQDTLLPTPNIQTPSLALGSSVSTYDSPRSIRRKPSTIQQYTESRRAGSSVGDQSDATTHRRDDDFGRVFKDSVLGISFPRASYEPGKGTERSEPKNKESVAPSEASYGARGVTRDATPPAPRYAQTATPSTRYTDSPFSHAPTPSSASSYSPGVIITSRTTTPQTKHQIPTSIRVPASIASTDYSQKSRLGLPPVRESSTSSSNSTVRTGRIRSEQAKKELPPKPSSAPPVRKPSDSSRSSSRAKLVKEKPTPAQTASNANTRQQLIPPELAHLNVEPSVRTSSDKGLRPSRPSRDGTPILTGISNPSPVVQSDLPRLYTTYHKRTPSQETPVASSPSFKEWLGLSPRGSSKHSSPRVDSAISPPPAARAFARGAPADSAKTGVATTRKDSPAVGTGPSPSPSKTHRFGFFSRKLKSESSKTVDKPQRPPSKGPTAGTGHEGYGRFGQRSRSGSTAGGAGFRSPSTSSSTSSQPRRISAGRQSSVTSKDGSELDAFLRERLQPVVLRGSGSTSNFSHAATSSGAPSVPASSTHSSLDSITQPNLLPSAMDSRRGLSPVKRPSLPHRAPSDSSEDSLNTRLPSIATRRSWNRLDKGDGKVNVRVPAPINTTSPLHQHPSGFADVNTQLTPHGAPLSSFEPSQSGEGEWLKSGLADPDIEPSKKWNFSQRAQTSPRNKGKGKAVESSEPADYTTNQYPPYRSMAHYATMDPVEPVDLSEVERIIQEGDTSPEDSQSDNNRTSRVAPYVSRHRGLPPASSAGTFAKDAPVRIRPAPPALFVRTDSAESPELLRAQQTVPHRAPSVIDIQRSPIIPNAESERRKTTLQPSGSQAEAPASRDTVRTPEMGRAPVSPHGHVEDDSPQRQPRLSPIGRIPKVVSRRDRDRKLSDVSFSRPFARTQPRPSVKVPQPPGSLYTQIRELASPIESGSQPVSSASTHSRASVGEPPDSLDTFVPSRSTDRTSIEGPTSDEFFAFTPRKGSDFSYTTSSGANSYIVPSAAHLAQREDVWDEYNDFMDEVMPDRTPLSAASSLGAPFQYSTALYDSPSLAQQPAWSRPPPRTQLPAPPRSNTVPAVLSLPQQIQRFMQPSMSPLTTPRAISDFFDHYGNNSTSTLTVVNRTSYRRDSTSDPPHQEQPSLRKASVSGNLTVNRTSTGTARASTSTQRRSSIPTPNRSSIPRPSRNSQPRTSQTSLPRPRESMASSARHSRSSGHSRSASLPEATTRNSQSSLTPSARFNRDTQLLDIPEVDGDEQAAVANLRFGALMTSKWLSFGRVLFSPAHYEMKLPDEPRVLIVDGLGSDWSYYVALTYPAATVCNLGPASENGTSGWPGVTQKPPSNHRHIEHTAISASFPFPKGWFTAVVFRFPVVATDQAYQACIFECKRVLKPGGYLEVATLDLDLMNMGNKARRELRSLKTRMQQHDQNVSLRNSSDYLVRQIGRRGFDNIQRCIVGVPAAGRIPRSQDISSVSSGGSGKPVWQREDRDGLEFSFADLLEDARSNSQGNLKSNDEGITKMVAKVGRWWYSTCFEKTFLDSDNSIWNDPALLRECEKQGTSFKLLICYAQKPARARQKAVSL